MARRRPFWSIFFKLAMTSEKTTLPSLQSLVRYSMPSSHEFMGCDIEPTKENFDALYDKFIRKYHTSNQCRIPDHINKFHDPPTYQKKTFSAFDLFCIVRECGGVHRVLSTN